MRTPLILLAGAALLATPAASQDFLGGLARQAAEAVIGRRGDTPVEPRPAAPPSRRGATSRQAPGAESANEYSDLEGLDEPARERACNQRVPLDSDGGRSFEKQQTFRRCMGSRYGEGA